MKHNEKTTKELRKFNVNVLGRKNFSTKGAFCTNRIKTAKYNIFTFLPLALFYQFRHFFNLFFLINTIIQCIPILRIMDPLATIMPFMVVIMISLVREAAEDFRKFQYDKAANNSLACVYTKGNFVEVKWEKLLVGSVIRINKDDILPVDVLVLKSSSKNGFCYLETTNLDGESSLKPREALSHCQSTIITEEDIQLFASARIEIDQPNKDIYKIEGTAFLSEGNSVKANFDIKNILLRGGRLKNTAYVYGVIIYTGKDTKLMQNINRTSSKLSSIDKKTNIIVIYIFCIVMLICGICTALGAEFRNANMPDYNEGELRADYLYHYDAEVGPDNSIGVAQIFTANFLIYTTLIPMSIIIIIAIVKVFQALSIEYFEGEFRLNEGDKVKCFSPSLQEEMGMVKYIFSDKTGTLTRNEMRFSACSIYTHLFADDEAMKDEGRNVHLSQRSSTCDKPHEIKGSSVLYIRHSLSQAISLDREIVKDDNEEPFESLKQPIEEFFLNLALNHDVLSDNSSRRNCYQGSNPDEVALVSFASEVGFAFIERDNALIQVLLNLNGIEETRRFQLLNKFDFTSARQRSSIIVKDLQTNKIKLYLKGSDKKVFESISSFSQKHLLLLTKEHVDNFAKKGLRTLCYSFKKIDLSAYEQWKEQYEDVKYKSILDKGLNSQLEALITQIEGNSILLGATALEDKLQEEVKEDLVSFIEAGINFWMITGDKMDTAESIGYSCRLFSDDTEVFKLKDTASFQSVIDRMKWIKQEIKTMDGDRLSDEPQASPSLLNGKDCKKKPIQTFNYHFTGNNKNIIDNSPIESQRRYSFDIELNHSFDSLHNDGEDESKPIHDTSILRYMVDKNCFENDSISYDKLPIGQRKVQCKQPSPKVHAVPNDNPITKTASQIFGVPLKEKQFANYFNYCNEQLSKIAKKRQAKNIDNVFNAAHLQVAPTQPKKNSKRKVDYSLIIEGESITHCLEKGEASELFWELIQGSHSMICCRCSPIQKGQVVDFVKRRSKAITLAIGDGGNDVNMIKTANVGVGIFGKEGYQAAYSSDYAISQFKYLKRLLFYNGHFGLERISYFIYFYFFKNVLFTFPQFLLGFYSGFSGTILYDSWYLMGYNSFVTVAPIAIRTVVEEVYDPEFKGYPVQSVFLKYLIPDIYKEYRESVPFNVVKFVMVFFVGVFFSLPVYFFAAFCFQYALRSSSGMTFGFWDVSLAAYLAIVAIHFFIICIDTMLYNWVIDAMYFFQLLVDVLFFVIYQSCDYGTGLSGDFYEILASLMFWLVLVLICAVCLVPFYLFRRIEFFFGSTIINRIKQSDCEEYFIEKFYKKKIGIMTQATRSVAKFRKIYSMKQDKEYDTLADQQMKKIVDEYKHKIKAIAVS